MSLLSLLNQFNALLLNRSIEKKKNPNFWPVVYFIKKTDLLLSAAALWQYTLFFSEKQNKSCLITPNYFFDLLNLMNYCKVCQNESDLQDYNDESKSAAIRKEKKRQNGLTKEKTFIHFTVLIITFLKYLPFRHGCFSLWTLKREEFSLKWI